MKYNYDCGGWQFTWIRFCYTSKQNEALKMISRARFLSVSVDGQHKHRMTVSIDLLLLSNFG